MRGIRVGLFRRSPQPSLGQSGTAALEYAIILPALLMMVLGAMDAGRAMWLQVTLERAVETAARCASVSLTKCGSAAQIQTYAVAQAFGTTLKASVFTSATASCGVKVTGSVPFTFVMPWMTKRNVTLIATACYPLQ